MTNEVVAGIDLGTTLSSIACIENGQPVIIPNAQNERLTPSVVAFKDDRVVVGREAHHIAQIDPYSAVNFIKRQMGNSSFFFLSPDGHSMPPEEISGIILKKLKIDAEQRVKREINKAVISVPAYFTDSQRRATKQAAEMAGLEVIRLINEPTAASIAYGITSSSRQETILVYDLGGGTFDVTILRLEGNDFRVLATDGNYKLGGVDFDNRLMLYLNKQFKDVTEQDIPGDDPVSQQKLRQLAEDTKKLLSSQNEAEIELAFNESTVKATVTRTTFEGLIADLINLTIFQIEEVLADAKLSTTEIDQVVLVGGSTRIPIIHELVTEKFGKIPDTTINPDEAVALGAAIVAQVSRPAQTTFVPDTNETKQESDTEPSESEQAKPQIVPSGTAKASKAQGQTSGRITIKDVTSHSLGVEVRNPGTKILEISHIIPRNSPIPIQNTRIYTTIRPDQRVVSLKAYEGESIKPGECVLIGGFNLEELPANRPSGVPISVTMLYNTNGIIEVTAIDLPTKKEAKITIHYEHGLSKKQFKEGESRLKLAELSFKEEWGWKEA